VDEAAKRVLTPNIADDTDHVGKDKLSEDYTIMRKAASDPLHRHRSCSIIVN
jgi:hypothetical protein